VKANILKSYTATDKTSLYQIPKVSKKDILHLGILVSWTCPSPNVQKKREQLLRICFLLVTTK